jgi:ABC-type multidrug transport system fused ATPase/permease subunit
VTGPPAPRERWRRLEGERVHVYALAGSYAEKRASGELREAERTVAALEELLEPPREARSAMVFIYLTDPVPDAPVPVVSPRDDADVIVRVVQPDALDEPLARPLTRALVQRWFGAAPAASALLCTGLAGVVRARAGTAPAIAEAHERVAAQLAAGEPVSIFSGENDTAATSFVAHLVETFGAPALRAFVASYDPDRRDQAALAAYHRPLGSLEESWLGFLRRREGRTDAFRALFRRLGPLLRPYWPREVEVLVLMLLGLSYTLALPLAAKYLFDTVIPERDTTKLVLFVLGLLLIYGLNAFLGMRRAYVTNWVNETVLIRLQERMFAALQRLGHDFYARAKVGDLMSRLSNDLTLIGEAMAQVVGVGVYQLLTVIAVAVTIVALSPLLGALVLVSIPVFAASYLLLRSRFQQASYEVQRLTGEAAAEAQESLSAHGVVKAFGLEDRAIRSYGARLSAMLRAYLRLVMIAALFETSMGLGVSSGQLVVLGVGGYLVIHGDVTIGTLVAFIGLLPSLLYPIAALSGVGQAVQRAAGALERVDELLDEPVTIVDRQDAEPLSSLSEEIRLEQVTFGYGDTRPVLRDVDLVIPAGRHTAIVGPSGSGKTSVLNLLLRFWDPDSGRVLFDGHDARAATLASLRGQIGIVFQDTFVFDTTIRENIALGLPGATDADVVAAAKAAQLHDYIESLPAGYDTVLGERGVRMSGGQRQRLAIARALIRDPRVLVLDEATSALDAQTERELLATLAIVARDRTTISITHRLSVAATADRIVVLDHGRVAEEGRHEDLVRAGGLYQELYEEQTGHVIAVERPRVTLATELLRSIPLFAGLDGEALALLSGQLTRARYEPGVDIVREGEHGESFFIVAEGRLDVVVGEAGHERRANVLEEGDYFGELALLMDEPRSATVRTMAPTELYGLDRARFTTLLDREPRVRAAVLDAVAGRRLALTQAAGLPTPS